MNKIKSLTSLVLQILLPYVLVGLGVYYFTHYHQPEHTPYWLGGLGLWCALWVLTPHYLIWFKIKKPFYYEGSLQMDQPIKIREDDIKWKVNNKLPTKIKVRASINMIKSTLRGLVVMPFSISAFFVVPIIMVFVKKSEDKLPGVLDLLWGDKNGLDGDNYWELREVDGIIRGIPVPPPLNPNPEQEKELAKISYFPGLKQRTYAYRVLWLLRNRSTNLGVKMGGSINHYNGYRYWGPKTDVMGAPKGQKVFGAYLMENNGYWEVYQVSKGFRLFGRSFLIRRRYGFKVANESSPFKDLEFYLRRREIEVINIAFSMKAYQPKDYVDKSA